jgi:hypothetical protein
MAKKRVPRAARHLRAVPPPAPRPQTFADLVTQFSTAYRARIWVELESLAQCFESFPETKQVDTADPQKQYFALAAWYWQEMATKAEHEQSAIFCDALDASRLAMERLVQRLYDRLGATGADDPSLQDVCQDFLTQIGEEMFEAMREAENRRIAARAAQEA